MKKILLLVAAIGLLAACATQSKEEQAETALLEDPVQTVQEAHAIQAAQPVSNKDCKINGHDCWEVVQKLGKTKEIHTENLDKNDIWAPDEVAYENPELAAWDIKVTFYTMYRDGGSTNYILDEKISIHTNHALGAKERDGEVTVQFKDGRKFAYNPDGTPTKPIN